MSFFSIIYENLSAEQENYLWQNVKYSILLPQRDRECITDEENPVPIFTFAFFEVRQAFANCRQANLFQLLHDELHLHYNENYFGFPYQKVIQGKESSLKVNGLIKFFKYYENLLMHVGNTDYVQIFNQYFQFEEGTTTKPTLQELDLVSIRISLYSIYRKYKLYSKKKIVWNDELYLELIITHSSCVIYNLLEALKEKDVLICTKALIRSSLTPSWLKTFINERYLFKEFWFTHSGIQVFNNPNKVWKEEDYTSSNSLNLIYYLEEFNEWFENEEEQEKRENWIDQLHPDVRETISILVECRDYIKDIYGSDWTKLKGSKFKEFFHCIVYNDDPIAKIGFYKLDAVKSFLQLSFAQMEREGFSACWTFDAIQMKSKIKAEFKSCGFSENLLDASLVVLAKRHYRIQVVEAKLNKLYKLTADGMKDVKSFIEYLNLMVLSLDRINKKF